MTRRPALVIAGLVLLLSSCSGSGHDAGDRRPTPSPPALTVGGCPGGGSAPLRCVRRGDRVVAQLELLRYPTRTIDVLRDAPPATTVRRLHAVARDAFRTFRSDRVATCGAGTSFTGPVVSDQTVAGHPGVHWWFALNKAGRVDELVDTWATVVGRRLVLVRSAGYAAHACLPPEGERFDPGMLTSLRPALSDVVARIHPPNRGVTNK